MEELIAAELRKQAAESGTAYTGPLTRATLLADTGLDSLGFTTLVIELERRLGVDPFASDDEIMYPETFGELLDLYEGARA